MEDAAPRKKLQRLLKIGELKKPLVLREAFDPVLRCPALVAKCIEREDTRAIAGAHAVLEETTSSER